MELTEFLLARIAEDEAPTWELIPYRCEPGCCAPAGFVGHRCHICNSEEFGGTVASITAIAQEHDEAMHRRSRMLAECEAKRYIVGLANWQGNKRTLRDRMFGPAADIAFQMGIREAMRSLATVYEDHPDSRDWTRP